MNVPDSDSEDELPPSWEERVTSDGSVFYVNHTTKETQWTHPRTGRKKVVSGELPFGWEKQINPTTGKITYVSHENQTTTYTDPRLAFAKEEKEHPFDIRQKFDASSTALQVLHGKDLNGKIALVTGANVGIGLEICKSLARHGCTIVMACRNLELAQAAAAKVESKKVKVVKLDLASLRQTAECAKALCAEYSKIDYLFLNAGVFSPPFTRTEDGYELTFQVCHLGHMALCLLLAPALERNSRIVVLSSESHHYSNLRTPEDVCPSALSPDSSSTYWGMMAYNNAKLCNVLFAWELAKRWDPWGVVVFSCHPGNMVSTAISRHWWLYRLLFALVRPFTKSLQQAAATPVYCATSEDLNGLSGLYFNNCIRCVPNNAAMDPAMGPAVWDISLQMIEEALGKDFYKST